MNVIISESQFNRLQEQIAGLPLLGGPSLFAGKSPKIDADDAVDAVSAGLEVIPGIGQLASLGIDLGHAGTYFLRFKNSTTDIDKSRYATYTIFGIIVAFMPMVGNIGMITSKKGLETFLKMTPIEVSKYLGKNGININVNLQKWGWKYNVLAALVSFFGQQTIQYLGDIVVNIKRVMTKVPKFKSTGNDLISFINDIKSV